MTTIGNVVILRNNTWILETLFPIFFILFDDIGFLQNLFLIFIKLIHLVQNHKDANEFANSLHKALDILKGHLEKYKEV